jgi:hypothetical protein
MERKTHVQQQQAKASCHAPWTNATIQHATSPKRWTSNAVTEEIFALRQTCLRPLSAKAWLLLFLDGDVLDVSDPGSSAVGLVVLASSVPLCRHTGIHTC